MSTSLMTRPFDLYMNNCLITSFDKQKIAADVLYEKVFNIVLGSDMESFINMSPKRIENRKSILLGKVSQGLVRDKRIYFMSIEEGLWSYIFYLYALDEKQMIEPMYLSKNTTKKIINEYKNDAKYLGNIDYLHDICDIASIVYQKKNSNHLIL